jgi:hypothetical protein
LLFLSSSTKAGTPDSLTTHTQACLKHELTTVFVRSAQKAQVAGCGLSLSLNLRFRFSEARWVDPLLAAAIAEEHDRFVVLSVVCVVPRGSTYAVPLLLTRMGFCRLRSCSARVEPIYELVLLIYEVPLFLHTVYILVTVEPKPRGLGSPTVRQFYCVHVIFADGDLRLSKESLAQSQWFEFALSK